MGGPGSGPRRERKQPREAERREPSAILTSLAAVDALTEAIRGQTQDPDILYSLLVRPSFTEDAILVSIGDAQERVSMVKLQTIQTTGQLVDFVAGLLDRARQKWNVKRDYTRIDLLNAVHVALLGILGRVSEESDRVMATAREALRVEFALPPEASVQAVTVGRMAFLNRVLEEAIVGLVAQPAAR